MGAKGRLKNRSNVSFKPQFDLFLLVLLLHIVFLSFPSYHMTQFGKEELTVNPLEGLLCVRCCSSRRDRHEAHQVQNAGTCVIEDICSLSTNQIIDGSRLYGHLQRKRRQSPCHQVIRIRLKRQMCSNKLHLVYVKGWTSYKYRRPWRSSEDQIAKRPRAGGISLTELVDLNLGLGRKEVLNYLGLEKSFWQTAPRTKAERDFQGVLEKVNNFHIALKHTQILTHFNSYLAGNMNYTVEKWKWDRRAQDVIGGWSGREVKLVFSYVEMGNLSFLSKVCVCLGKVVLGKLEGMEIGRSSSETLRCE